jgi:hypothetical protein
MQAQAANPPAMPENSAAWISDFEAPLTVELPKLLLAGSLPGLPYRISLGLPFRRSG